MLRNRFSSSQVNQPECDEGREPGPESQWEENGTKPTLTHPRIIQLADDDPLQVTEQGGGGHQQAYLVETPPNSPTSGPNMGIREQKRG